MNNNVTVKQCVSIIILFLSGTTLILGSYGQKKQDIWLILLLSMILSIILVYIYSKIMAAYPSKDFYDIATIVLGKPIGTIINIFYIWYSFYLTSLVLRDFGEFIKYSGLHRTPLMITMITIMVIIAFAASKGIQTLARGAGLLVYIFVVVMILSILLEIPLFDLNNLKPALMSSPREMTEAVMTNLSFPFGEIVIFLGVLHFNEGKSYFKCFSTGILLGGLLIILVNMATVLILGDYHYSDTYFPHFEALTRVNIFEVVQRIEIILSGIDLVGGFVKLTMCLLCCINGLSKLVPEKNADFLIKPVSILVVIISYTTFDNILELFEDVSNYPIFAFPFQVIIPILVLIIIKIKKKADKSSSTMSNS